MKNTAMASVLVLFAGVVLLTSGCANVDDANDPATNRASMAGESASASCVLSYVNDPLLSLHELDDVAGLHRDAASNLLVHRDGSDRTPRTFDDNLFDDLAEIEAVRQVGQVTLQRLRTAAIAWCESAPERAWEGTFHGVSFTVGQTDVALTLVNTMTERELATLFAGADHQVIDEIVARREIMSLDMLVDVPGLSRREMGALRSAALRW